MLKLLASLLILAAALPSAPALGQNAYPIDAMVDEFEGSCSDLDDLSAVAERAVKNGWSEAEPAAGSWIAEQQPIDTRGKAGIILPGHHSLHRVLSKEIAGRTVWLILSDYHFSNSERLKRDRSCLLVDESENVPPASSFKERFVGETFEIMRGNVIDWVSSPIRGTTDFTIKSCSSRCSVLDPVGLRMTASIEDWVSGTRL